VPSGANTFCPRRQGIFYENIRTRTHAPQRVSDPLIRSLMAADKVDPAKLEAMLTKIAGEIAANVPPAVRGCACIARYF
jgi:hypothetical protein